MQHMQKLEEITLDKETSHYKKQMALKFGELVYNGQWYTPLAQGADLRLSTPPRRPLPATLS